MSVIQEALRRKQEEEAARPATPVPPPAPARSAQSPVPPRPAQAPRSRPRRGGLRFLLLGIMVVLLVGIAVLLWPFTAWRPQFAAMIPRGAGGPGIAVAADAESAVAAAPWPRIRLGSLAKSSGGTSSALLNGRLILIGDEIEGVTLVDVADNGVTLERDGDRRFIRLGAQTP